MIERKKAGRLADSFENSFRALKPDKLSAAVLAQCHGIAANAARVENEDCQPGENRGLEEKGITTVLAMSQAVLLPAGMAESTEAPQHD